MRQLLSVTPVGNLSATLSVSASVALACRRAGAGVDFVADNYEA